MSEIAGAPPEVAMLLERLTADGFTQSAEIGTGVINHELEIRNEQLNVRVVVDRGQWFVEAGRFGGDYFDADVWAACITGKSIAFEPSSLRDQAVYITENWRALCRFLVADGAADCLLRARSRRARKRLGLPPSVDDELS